MQVEEGLAGAAGWRQVWSHGSGADRAPWGQSECWQREILVSHWFVHTKRSLTAIPTCGRQGSTTTNTKLTYNLFTLGPSVRLVENLADDQLPLLLLLQVPKVVLVHHAVGPLLLKVLVGVQHQNLFCCPSAGRWPSPARYCRSCATLRACRTPTVSCDASTCPVWMPWNSAGRNACLGHSVWYLQYWWIQVLVYVVGIFITSLACCSHLFHFLLTVKL